MTLQRQQFLSNEELKQPPRPRIVIEKMADINETIPNVDKPEGYLQRKRSDVRENGENDDDDDVVMDNEKSTRDNQDGVSEGLINGSKSPLIPRQPISRPGTATIESASKYHDKASKESADDVASITSQSRPSSVLNNDKEGRKDEEKLSRPPSSKESIVKKLTEEIDVAKNLAEDFVKDEISALQDSMNKSPRPPSVATFEIIEEVEKPSSPYSIFGNVEQSLKAPPKSSDNSRAATPSSQNAEQAASRPLSRMSDKSRSSTPAHLDPSENAERNKTPDKSRSGTPAGLESRGSAEQESKTPDQHSRASTPVVQLSSSPNAEKEPRPSPTKTPDKSRSSTPAGIESSGGKVSTEDPHRDKSGEDTLQVRESSRPGSSLGSSNLSGKDNKSPKSPRSPTMSKAPPKDQGKLSPSDSTISPTTSPGAVKGFDNGEQRSLSSGGSPRAKSPKSPAKQTEGEKKKKTSFVETADEKSAKIADAAPIPTATSPSKPKSPRPQTPARLEDEKSAKKKGSRAD